MKFSIVVPVYGCKAALEELYQRITKTMQQISKSYEIILVNDSCPQNSIEVIEQLCQKDKHVIGIDLSRNFGQMKAILAGLDYATGEYVIVMDCDLQDRPEEIINLYKKIQEGYDIVFARRMNRQDNKLKIFISNLFYKIYSIASGIKYDQSLCNFSICRHNVINAYCSMREENRAYVMYLQWLGFKQATIDVKHDPRKEGKSSYNFKKRFKLAIDIIFSQSDKILKLIASFGFLITIFSFLFIIFLLVQYFTGNVLPGWSSLIATIMLMSGIIIFLLGVVGIYIGNIFIQVKQRPLYIIKEIKNKCKGD